MFNQNGYMRGDRVAGSIRSAECYKGMIVHKPDHLIVIGFFKIWEAVHGLKIFHSLFKIIDHFFPVVRAGQVAIRSLHILHNVQGIGSAGDNTVDGGM